MYEAFFGLREKPFAMTPDPHFLYLSRTHEDALAHLRYGLEQRVGFIAVTGEVGTGKTTVLRSLFNSLDEGRYRVALIFNPCLSPSGLMQAIVREFGLTTRRRSLPGLVELLNGFLLEENHAGRTPVLVIDEAQNLEPEVLEQIRLLSNLETERDKLIQIVLVGQPELDVLLERRELRQLAQRIVVRCRLRSLDPAETRTYAEHRLQIAGADRRLFAPTVWSKIYRETGGVPRLINILCDRALLTAFAQGVPQVSASELRAAARELADGRGRTGQVRFDRRYWLLAASLPVVVIFLALVMQLFSLAN